MKNKLPSMNILLNGSKTVNGRYGYNYDWQYQLLLPRIE